MTAKSDAADSTPQAHEVPSVVALLVGGARVLLGAPVLTAVLCAVAGIAGYLIEGHVGAGIHAINRGDIGLRASLFTGLMGAAGLLILWTLFLALFRVLGTRRRGAWWLPSLLTAPSMLLAVSFSPALDDVVDEVAPAALGYAGVGLAWWLLGLGTITTIFAALGRDAHAHGSVSTGRALAAWRPRWLDALASTGGATIWVFLGLQVLWVPGLFYATDLAFVPHAALDRPDRASHRRSRWLARSGWWRVFGLLTVGGILVVVLQLLSLLLAEVLVSAAGFPTYASGGPALGKVLIAWTLAPVWAGGIKLPALGMGLSSAASTLVWGAVTAGLYELYAALLAKRRASGGATTASVPDEKRVQNDPFADFDPETPTDPGVETDGDNSAEGAEDPHAEPDTEEGGGASGP